VCPRKYTQLKRLLARTSRYILLSGVSAHTLIGGQLVTKRERKEIRYVRMVDLWE
jgi:hypothetical protein